MLPRDRLTPAIAESALPKAKPYKLTDGGGLYLEIHPNGSKYWRLKFRWSGREKRLALGVYPATSIADARLQRDQAKRELAADFNPIEMRRQRKLEGSAPDICFGLSMSAEGRLSIASAGKHLNLTRAQTDVIRALLKEGPSYAD